MGVVPLDGEGWLVAEVGTIYLLHFDEPFKHARHYSGWTRSLQARLDHHAAGYGANLLRHVQAAGIGWQVVQTWSGTRDEERWLKRQGSGARFCPVCHETPRKPRRLTPVLP